MVQTVELIKTLTNAVGLSGYEASIQSLLKEQFLSLADDVTISKVGSVIALKRGSPPPGVKPKKLMLAAHADEIGLIVTGVDRGFLRVARVGGIDARILLGQRVLVHTTQHAPRPAQRQLPESAADQHTQGAVLAGLVASRPPHVIPAQQREKVVPIDELFVDVGLPASQVARQVHVGDLVSFDVQTLPLRNDLLTGKAMDNRVSVVAMMVCLDELKRLRHTWDVLAIATVGEETSFAGARTSAYAVEPDAAIAIDVTFAAQHDYSTHIELGKGPVIAIGPNYHPGMTKRLIELAKRLEMDYQIDPDIGGGTDAWPIQVSREGIPVALLSVPLRYMHSPVETVNVKDVERIGRLMAHFVTDLGDAI